MEQPCAAGIPFRQQRDHLHRGVLGTQQCPIHPFRLLRQPLRQQGLPQAVVRKGNRSLLPVPPMGHQGIRKLIIPLRRLIPPPEIAVIAEDTCQGKPVVHQGIAVQSVAEYCQACIAVFLIQIHIPIDHIVSDGLPGVKAGIRKFALADIERRALPQLYAASSLGKLYSHFVIFPAGGTARSQIPRLFPGLIGESDVRLLPEMHFHLKVHEGVFVSDCHRLTKPDSVEASLEP